MTTKTVTETLGLVKAEPRLLELTATPIRTVEDLTNRARDLQAVAHVLSPFASISIIPADIAIDPVVVILDPRVDPETGRGADVYYSRSIHQSRNEGTRDDPKWTPTQVSLNKIGLLKMVRAAGLEVTQSRRTDRGNDPHYCEWTTWGRIREIDGSFRDIPPGDAKLDLRDGSADIGEWTPKKWADAVAKAEAEKARAPEKTRWKIKPEPIGGFTLERVLGQRRKITALCQTFSLERLARNLGIAQVYDVADLQKPFVFMRATHVPDMSDPEVRKIVTMARFGALHLLYPGAAAGAVPMLPAAAVASSSPAPSPIAPDDEIDTAAPPADAEVLSSWPEPASQAEPSAMDPVYVWRVLKRGEWFYAETYLQKWQGRPGPTYVTRDEAVGKGLFTASQNRVGLDIDDEPVEVDGKPYRQVVSYQPVTITAPDLLGRL